MKGSKKNHDGLRYNDGKNRLDLIPAFVREQIGRVLTKGAQKYEDRNWEKGMAWTNPIASLERHLNAFKGGEDYDPETEELHVAHVAVNAMFLIQYYLTYPQGDDRAHKYLERPKIGLDIDEVIADWLGAWMDHFDIDKQPKDWYFDYEIINRFERMDESGALENMYTDLDPLIAPEDIPFSPHCYITSRPVPTKLTKMWLERHGFPTAPVYTVGVRESKADVAKEAEIDWFVDDCFDNFKELNNAGIACFLMDRPHNKKYNVGYKRISNLSDLFNPMDRE